MLLLTYREWIGPGPAAYGNRPRGSVPPIEPRESIIGMVTNMSLPEAIEKVHDYENRYRKNFDEFVAVNFTLLSVTEIPDLDKEQVRKARLSLVEALGDTLST